MICFWFQARLITCVSCDDACHQYCLFPPILDRNLSRWVCGNCVHKQFDKVIGPTPPPKTNSRSSTPPGNVPILPPVLSPQVSPNRASPEQMDEEVIIEPVDPNIPDASDWSSEQVYQYFARLFPKEAEVFRQQVRFYFWPLKSNLLLPENLSIIHALFVQLILELFVSNLVKFLYSKKNLTCLFIVLFIFCRTLMGLRCCC